MNIRIERLRKVIMSEGLDGYIIPTNDEFMSEYPTAPHAKGLEYLTEFACSNGLLIITHDNILFFTDARYKTAAKDSLKYALVFDIFEIKTFDFEAYIPAGKKIGYDQRLFTSNTIKPFKKLNLIEIKENLVNKIWENRPAFPSSDAWHYDLKYTGTDSDTKFSEIRKWLNEKRYESLMLTSPESVCWLLNIRANDSDFSPIMLCMLYLDFENIILFTNPRKFCKDTLPAYVEVRNCVEISDFLKNLKQKICVTNEANLCITNSIGTDHLIIDEDPTLLLRAIKNEAEITGAEQAHIKDAVALCEFFAWLQVNLNEIDEYKIGLKLSEFRSKQDGYLMDSFPPICGFAQNSAKIHYRADKKNAAKITEEGLLLLDSGGHYYGGTTDITRTIAIGKTNKEQKRYYTKVLKGHLALAKIKFPKGIKGANLDVLARQYIWSGLEDYQHGTGHGVGNALFVHEGPMRISLYDSKIILEPGMILSNEPGYYRDGAFGIRIENLQYLKNCDKNPKFLEFQQLSLVPYCSNLIIYEDLAKDEIEYLQTYYKKIEQKILPLLSESAKKYVLKELSIVE